LRLVVPNKPTTKIDFSPVLPVTNITILYESA